jgi:hypothetical protein
VKRKSITINGIKARLLGVNKKTGLRWVKYPFRWRGDGFVYPATVLLKSDVTVFQVDHG